MTFLSKINFQSQNFTKKLVGRSLSVWTGHRQMAICPSIIGLNYVFSQSLISIHVVSQIPKPDFGPCPHKANCPENQIPGCHRLNSGNMLHSGSNSGAGSVALLFPISQFLMAAAFALKMLSISLLAKPFYRILNVPAGGWRDSKIAVCHSGQIGSIQDI